MQWSEPKLPTGFGALLLFAGLLQADRYHTVQCILRCALGTYRINMYMCDMHVVCTMVHALIVLSAAVYAVPAPVSLDWSSKPGVIWHGAKKVPTSLQVSAFPCPQFSKQATMLADATVSHDMPTCWGGLLQVTVQLSTAVRLLTAASWLPKLLAM